MGVCLGLDGVNLTLIVILQKVSFNWIFSFVLRLALEGTILLPSWVLWWVHHWHWHEPLGELSLVSSWWHEPWHGHWHLGHRWHLWGRSRGGTVGLRHHLLLHGHLLGEHRLVLLEHLLVESHLLVDHILLVHEHLILVQWSIRFTVS